MEETSVCGDREDDARAKNGANGGRSWVRFVGQSSAIINRGSQTMSHESSGVDVCASCSIGVARDNGKCRGSLI